MPARRLQDLATLARAFEPVGGKTVFYGSAALAIYATSQAAPEIRSNRTVDCVLGRLALLDQQMPTQSMKQSAFELKKREGLITHWTYADIPLRLLLCRNAAFVDQYRWLAEGLDYAESHEIDGQSIRIYSPAYFLAAKMEAFDKEGKYDYRYSEDFEDILYLLDNRPEIVMEVNAAFYEVRTYIQGQFSLYLADPYLEEGMYTALPIGTDAAVVGQLMDLMREMVDYQPNLCSRSQSSQS
ncbi:MAG: hypothetical protein AAF206_25665 [Bacteroidota bacterium]